MNDLISRQAAIDALARDEEYNEDIPDRADGVRDAIITIMGLPSAQPKKGKWILIRPDKDKAGNGLYECSECGEGDIHAPEAEVPFCWHCGAHMTGSGSVKERG